MRYVLIGSMLVALGTTPFVGAVEAPSAVASGATTPAPEPNTSPEYSGYTYMEKSGEFTVLVYSWPTHWRTTEAFFPLVIAVGRTDEQHKKGETPAEKKETRESVIIQLSDFGFVDSQGKVYHPAPYEQIFKEYKYLMSDKDMAAEEPMATGNLFDVSTMLNAVFYPVGGGGRVPTSAIEMETFTWFMTTLYFPHPDAGLGGVMTLTLGSEKVTPPISVKFKLPEAHEKKKK